MPHQNKTYIHIYVYQKHTYRTYSSKNWNNGLSLIIPFNLWGTLKTQRLQAKDLKNPSKNLYFGVTSALGILSRNEGRSLYNETFETCPKENIKNSCLCCRSGSGQVILNI
ncbi:hypothetical protein V6Z12_A06G106200 [Gossypium hirsutum]